VVTAAVTLTFDCDGYVTHFCEANTEGIVLITSYWLTLHTPGSVNWLTGIAFLQSCVNKHQRDLGLNNGL